MATKLYTILVAFSMVALFPLDVIARSGHQIPKLCDADGESREECDHNRALVRTHRSNYSSLRTEKPLPVSFRLYNNFEDPEAFVEIFPHHLTSVEKANPHNGTGVSWKILIPGFPLNKKSPFPDNVRLAYLQRMREFPHNVSYNILVVDWGEAGCPEDTVYSPRMTYTEAVGTQVAKMVMFLHNNYFLDFTKNVHVIGFSMGAHVAGEMARHIFRQFTKEKLLYRISALDPLSKDIMQPYINRGAPRPSPMRKLAAIRRSFVWFLDVYHTSKDYGIQRRLGDIDFYPNGGWNQDNACERKMYKPTYQQLCCHVWATELFALSINNRTMHSCTGCDHFDVFEKKGCGVRTERCEDTVIVGDAVDENLYMDIYPMASGRSYFYISLLGYKHREFGNNLYKRWDTKRSDNAIPMCYW